MFDLSPGLSFHLLISSAIILPAPRDPAVRRQWRGNPRATAELLISEPHWQMAGAAATLAAWHPILVRARSGTMLSPPVGEEGSAGWRPGDRIPRKLILCDLDNLPAVLPEFPSEFGVLEELDLSGNGFESIPWNVSSLTNLHMLFLGGGENRNHLSAGLPSLSELKNLNHISAHDTDLPALPPLPASLRILRVDRCPLHLEAFPSQLPAGLTTLHLEGCPLPGTLEDPQSLPDAVRALENLEDLQLPDGGHVGAFFGTPLKDVLNAAPR